MLKYYIIKIEAHLTKSSSQGRLPKPWAKGVGAEADAVAGIALAIRIRSALLSQVFCEELSTTQPIRVLGEIAVLRLSFFILIHIFGGYTN